MTIDSNTLKKILMSVKEFRNPVKHSSGNMDSTNKLEFQDNQKTINHYVQEIVRYFNTIQFITRKTFRVIQKTSKNIEKRDFSNFSHEELLNYLVYRYFWEKATQKQITKELPSQIGLKKFEKKILTLFISRLDSFSWDIALRGKSDIEKSSIKHSIPTFFAKKLLPYLTIDEIKAAIHEMDAFKSRNITYFHILDHNIHTQQNLDSLTNQGIEINQDENFSDLYRTDIKYRSKLISSEEYQNGIIRIQDKTSFTTVKLLDPQPNEIIADLCAAPGIKTELIYKLVQCNSKVFASDYNFKRLNLLNSVSLQSDLFSGNLNNLTLLNIDAINYPLRNQLNDTLFNRFDRILLDAPCTGSGTFGRSPELKWRQNQKFLNRNVFLQEKLINSALNLLKPGGKMVYSVCSMYPEEGELQILKIKENIKMLKFPNWLPPSYSIKNEDLKGMARFSPHLHNTTGFFISVFEKL